MSRKPATIIQADVRRVIAAAKQARADHVEVRIGDASIIIHLASSTGGNIPLAPRSEIDL